MEEFAQVLFVVNDQIPRDKSWWGLKSLSILPFSLLEVLMTRVIRQTKGRSSNELMFCGQDPISKGISNILCQTSPMTKKFLRLRESRFVGIQVEDRLVE